MKPEWCDEKTWQIVNALPIQGDGFCDDDAMETIAKALLTARQEGRKEAFEEVKSVVSEYVWDDHALAQATDIGRAVHHQSVEILEAVSKAGEA